MLNETNEFESFDGFDEELHELCKELRDALKGPAEERAE
jgi:hypothetical protein